jgi:hypothetical protein
VSLPPDRNDILMGYADRDYYRVNNVGPNPPPVFNEQLVQRQLRRDFLLTSSYVTPNFRRLPFRLLPINRYEKWFLEDRSPKSSLKITSTDATGTTYYTVRENWAISATGSLFDSSTTADDPTQKVISKLIESIGTAKADAATSMAELGKTASHLAHTATRVYKGITALRKGRFGDFAQAIGISYTITDVRVYNRRYAKAVREDGSKRIKWDKLYLKRGQSRVTDLVADTWLEYSYGWKPLLNDVFNIAQATASVIVERQRVVRYKTERGENRKVTTKVVDGTGSLSKTLFESRRSTAIGVMFRIPDGALHITDAFGLSNPLTVAWEIIPFSFVVDWFLPVGDALKGLTAFSGLEFHDGWITRKTFTSATGTVDLKSFTSGGVSHTRSGRVQGSIKTFTIGRDRLTSFPSYGFPEWKDPRSFAHAASAIALLQSLFLRK